MSQKPQTTRGREMAKAGTIPGFTEGPWVLSPNGTHIRKTLHGYNICSLDESAPDVIREANARLIAAAPDLYAVVKLVKERRYANFTLAEWHQIDAALSRVEQPQ